MLVKWNGGPTIPTSASEISVTGYKLYMDGGNDGNYRVIYDGTNLPGTVEYLVTAEKDGIQPGRAYRFRVSAINFNGEGAPSVETTLFICLSPFDFAAPTYSSSTQTTLTINWQAPKAVNGCPIIKYQLFRDAGTGGDINVAVGGDIEPHTTTATITFTPPSTDPIRVQLKASNDVGSVLSGVGSFVLADVPDAPAAPVNDAAVTSDARIKVKFAETLPLDRGSLIRGV